MAIALNVYISRLLTYFINSLLYTVECNALLTFIIDGFVIQIRRVKHL